MVTIFDELEDYGYSEEIIRSLKEEWTKDWSEQQIHDVFVDNDPLKRKLLHVFPLDVFDRSQEDEEERKLAWRRFYRARVVWQNSMLCDMRWRLKGRLRRNIDILHGIQGNVIDPRDSRTYKTIKLCSVVIPDLNGAKIGSGKTWLAENLQFFGNERTFDALPLEMVERFGRFYSFEEAKAAVIPGWHLPTEEDVLDLLDYGLSYIGESESSMLKSKDGWGSKPGAAGLDSFGFGMLAAGFYDADVLTKVGEIGAFWVDRDYDDYAACLALTDQSGELGYPAMMNKKYRLSVRLVRDE